MSPETMKVAVMTGTRQVEIREIAKPVPRAGEILVKIKACALCTLEQRTYTGVDKMAVTRYPWVGGHEYSGVIESIAEGTNTNLKVGDHVVVGASSCGQCLPCRIGETTKCENLALQRGAPYEGLTGAWGLSGYRAATVDRIYKVASDLPFEEAALSEPTACVVHAHRKLGLKMSEDVLVIGSGTMGLLNMMVAKAAGARVFVSDIDSVRAQKALTLGAQAILNPKEVDVGEEVRKLTDGRGADVVIVAIGSGAANKQAVQAMAPLGRMMLFASAHPAEDLCVDPNFVHRQQVTITGSMSGDVQAFVVATRLLSAGILNVKPLIETTIPLANIKDALELASRAERTYRVVVTM